MNATLAIRRDWLSNAPLLRCALPTALMAICASVNAQTVDLVIHNGFEAFFVQGDGNNGNYMAYLRPASAVTVDSDSFSGSDLFRILTITSVSGSINAQAESVASAQMVVSLGATAAGQSVCPLTP